MTQLHHPLRTRQIPQQMRTEIGHPSTVREPINHQLLGRARQQGLAAVPQVAQPRRPIDRRPRVVTLIAQLDLAGMHTNPQSDRRQRRALQRQRGRHRIRGAREGRHKAIALALPTGRTPSWVATMSDTA
jgi:hypothetical protein